MITQIRREQIKDAYYTDSEIDSILAGYSQTGHAHTESDITDLGDYLPVTHFADIKRQGFLNQTQTTIAFNDSTYTFTLADAGAGWSYWRDGYRYNMTGNRTVVLPGTPPASGHWYIYIDAVDGTLSASQTAWTLRDAKVPVASIWWNNSLTPKYWLADERHTALIDSSMQYYIHATIGVAMLSAPSLSGYTVTPASPTNTHNTFAISACALLDQDLRSDIASLADPDGVTSSYVVCYRTGASTWAWEYSPIPYRFTSGGYIQYDNAGTMTQGSGSNYYNSYLLVTNLTGDARHVIVPGRGSFASLAAAQAEVISAFTWSGFEIDETVIVYRLTWQTNASYSTSGKCRLAATPQAINLATVTNASSGAGTDHETLENLLGGEPNDHYHLTLTQHTDLTDGGDSTLHTHDNRYYTETEADARFGRLASANVWTAGNTFPIVNGNVRISSNHYGIDTYVNLNSSWARQHTFRNDYAGATGKFGFGVYGNATGAQRAFVSFVDAGENCYLSVLGMHILSSGYIGFGTTNPRGPHHIHSGATTNEAKTLLYLTTVGNYEQYGAKLQIVRGSSLAQKWRFIATKDSDGADVEVLNLTETGVGVGTTSPGYLLDVYGSPANYVAKFRNVYGADAGHGVWIDTRWNTSGNYPLRVTSNQGTAELLLVRGDGNVVVGSGNVSIGANAAPGSQLTMRKAVANSTYVARILMEDTGSVADTQCGIDWYNATNNWMQGRINVQRQGSGSNFDMIFSPAASGALVEAMRLTQEGYVGIGTVAPAKKLHVVGAADIRDASGNGLTTDATSAILNGLNLARVISGSGAVEIQGGSTIVTVNVDGVGINEPSPEKALHVAGTILIDGDEGGYAGTIGLTDVSNTATNSTGTGSIKMKGTTSRDSTGFIKIYVGTTAYYVPFFAAITG